ncbi:unnamed protein product [Allacma fusca]|uniref:Uncharacterized protein n=1 Tax=Allacma fusca TaxID=39272 RepID=A0A8J2LIX6_9HEXA|nr:unnamed protein product [Allacma fusca]
MHAFETLLMHNKGGNEIQPGPRHGSRTFQPRKFTEDKNYLTFFSLIDLDVVSCQQCIKVGGAINNGT